MTGKSKHKIFWKKVKSKYKLSFFNENTLEEVWTFRLSRLTAFLGGLFIVAVIFSAAAFFIVVTPVKNLLPGYLKTKDRIQLVDNALTIDSLQRVAEMRDRYINRLRIILSGEIPLDSIQVTDSLLAFPTDTLLNKSEAEAAYAQKFEEEEKYTLSVFSNAIPTDGLIFFPPVKGIIKKMFNLGDKHYGIDVLPPRQSGISAALDGTVVFAGYTVEYGYVILLQHSFDFLTVYKYNSALLKQVGDRVIGGEKIAIVGSRDDDSDTPLLEFQLWYKGQPLNPTDYISF